MASSSAKLPSVLVTGAGESQVNLLFKARKPADVPAGFAATCKKMMWDPKSTWMELSDQKRLWFEAENGSYIYWNQSDGRWWLDGPSGAGLYIVENSDELPPSTGWRALRGVRAPLPSLKIEV
mmetsp:Transcript_22209/g.31009  ORF Transcript_22209/g.31009 Transcript_22209/m.31009 type:complete len:123 (-) Transcript_22209:96-464(-)